MPNTPRDMTTNAPSDAPERIWVKQFSAPFNEKYWSQSSGPENAIEYIRADLAAADAHEAKERGKG